MERLASRSWAGTAGEVVGRAWRATLDLLFPPLCVGCRARVGSTGTLCARCWEAVEFLEGPACARCGLPFDADPGGETVCAGCYARPPTYDRARAVLRYDEASKAPILAFKHGDRLENAPAFARWLHRVGQPFLADADIIVPVPLHRYRLWRRRYNQAAVLAHGLARYCAKPVRPFALVRTRPTQSQGAMPSAKARRRNVLGAFRVPKAALAEVKGRAVLLVDDVQTTGATADACARALKRAGAAKVMVLTLARVVRPAAETI